jgi:glycosyltransferase involved in cell wall biosynthesis
MADLGVIILTYNEALHIERAIRSVQGVARRIVVVDSFSTDDTVARAQGSGAMVLTNPWINYAVQFQWGMDNADLDTEWIMRLDADEIIEPDLAERLEAALPTLPPDVTGVLLNRKHIFMGRFIRHGGRYPMNLLRIWRRGCGAIEQRWMDEHVRLVRGRAVALPGGFCDANLNDLTFFTQKHNAYAVREAVDVILFDIERNSADPPRRLTFQAKLKRTLKENIYNKSGLFGPFIYFLYRYFLRLGFLDGREGLIYHTLQGFWYRFLVAAKVAELRQALKGIDGSEAKLAELSKLTGLRLPTRD